MEEQREQILKGNLRSLLFKFSTPAIIGMVVSALYNIIDTLFVGQGVGPLAISALTIVFPIQLIIMAVGIMIGIGAASVISRALGANEKEKALRAANVSILLTLIISGALMIPAYIFMDELLYFFGASSSTFPLAKDYMSIILIGFISFSFAISANNLIRAEGKPRAAMYTMIIGALANIALDPIFIFGFKMGVRGAAIATIISQFLSVVYVIIFLSSKKSIYQFNTGLFRLKPALSKEIIAIGFPSFAMQVVGSAVFIIFNRSVLHYGNDMYIAVMGIGLRVLSLIEMPIIGIAQGFSTLVSFNYGAKLYQRVKTVLREAVIWTFIIAGAGFIAMMGFPGQILGLFTNDPNLIQIGITPIRIIVILLPFIGFQILGGSLFQAIGKTIPALIIILSRQLLLLVPAVLILPLFFGLTGIWLAVPVASFFSVLITFGFVYWQNREFNRLILLESPESA
jgi:putative MATE family efflux protein